MRLVGRSNTAGREAAEMPGTWALLLALPWLALALAAPTVLARRTRITSFMPPAAEDSPLVSVIVPARNEAVNISVCVASLLNTTYPAIEIIVVDDGSTDGTADIVRILADHSEGRVQLVDGEPLPDGWLGKPWACWQGYSRARGELLLFTDADTRHDDALLGHAAAALRDRDADLVSVLPRQLMLSFWERLVLPQIFSVLTFRFHNLERVNSTRDPRDVIANGQFMLMRREAYDAIGGHAAIRSEVVEDLRLAQKLVESGRRIFIAHAHDIMDTRMYRSLGGIIEGWSKNLSAGSRRAAPRWIAPAIPWLIAAFLVVMWVVPPVMVLAGLFTPLVGSAGRGWGLTVSLFSLLFWMINLIWMRVPVQYALGYPLGATLAAALFIRSAVRGSRVEWKGRKYQVGTDP
jgi:chlorobactene glucosyltransferase